MAEMLFGSGPQLWPALPVPGFRAPFASATMPSAPMLVSPSAPDSAQLNAGWPVAASAPVGAGLPTLMVPDFATAITPQALLTAVAVRRGQPMGPTSDQEIEDFISDALDLLSGANDVEIRCEAGRAALTGSVPNKRLKRDVGEIVWTIPSVNDVQNNVTIAARRRSRTARDAEAGASAGASRKQA
jgi:hypothetical protein